MTERSDPSVTLTGTDSAPIEAPADDGVDHATGSAADDRSATRKDPAAESGTGDAAGSDGERGESAGVTGTGSDRSMVLLRIPIRPFPREVRARIEEAVRIIGGDSPGQGGFAGPAADTRGDYVIAPLEHAERYEQSAPELAERLRMSDVRVSAENYTDRDTRANELRREFETKSERARTAVLVSGIAAALLVASAGVYSIPGVNTDLLKGTIIALSIVAVTASALAAGWIQAIRGGTLLERWMKRRAEAEAERLRYFSLVMEATRLEQPLLQLEYFRRYQLDVQRAYFNSRGDDHRRHADRQLSVVAASMAFAGIATGLAGVLGASLGAPWTSLAALALVAQAFSGRAENREAAEQSGRNAERYEQTRVSLNQLYGMLDSVRGATAAAAPGDDLAVMRQYVAAVHDRLAVEHRQWLDDTKLAGEAVAQLEILINEAAQKTKTKPL